MIDGLMRFAQLHLENGFLYLFNDVFHIFICHPRTCWQTKTYLKDFLLHSVGVNHSIRIYRLLVHGLPHRTGFNPVCRHKHTQCLHVVIGLTVCRGTLHSFITPAAPPTAVLSPLIGILLTLYPHIGIQRSRTEPVIRVITRIGRLSMDMHAPHLFQTVPHKNLHMLVMVDMFLYHRHLSATDTCTNITHTIVVANGRMLIVRISITRCVAYHMTVFLSSTL